MSIELTVKLDIPDPDQMLAKRNLELGGEVQKVIDKRVIDYSIPYCPFDTGVLANSAYSASNIGSGLIVYNTLYAHYLYHGQVYGPNIPVFDDDSGTPTRWFSPPGKPKHPTGKELTYKTDLSPMAGPFWIDRMKADRMDDILKEARGIAGLD